MSKFNLRAYRNYIKYREYSDYGDYETINNEGAIAYSMNDKEKQVTQVLTSFFNENKFYRDNSQDILDTVNNVIKSEASFVANLCIYARNEMHLRTISHVLASELAKSSEGKDDSTA